MFQARKFFKHERNTDVALEVQKILGKSEDGSISLLVSWWNIKAKVPAKIVKYEAVSIKQVEVCNWKEYDLRSGGRVA